MPDRPTIFLLTDFGNSDHYIAVVKAVILSRCPAAQLVDITHNVPPQGVESGAYLLGSSWPWLPAGSVVLAVVDPGVGTAREAAVFCADDKCIVGPNNGLIGFLPGDTPGRVLDRPEFWQEPVSATFHGRDIFAPCVAFLAAGGHWTQLGGADASPRQIEVAGTPEQDGKRGGRIIHFDHFGNAITHLVVTEADRATAAEIPGRLRCPISRTFDDVPPGKPVAYIGSTGRLELAVNGGNAKNLLDLQIGDNVYIETGAVNT